MKRIITIFTMLTFMVGINILNTNPAQAVLVSSIEKIVDFNNDGKINGFDWNQMSLNQKQNLITAYYSSEYQTMLVNMSTSTKDREIFRVISRLNYYYSGVNTENKIVDVWDTYQLLVE